MRFNSFALVTAGLMLTRHSPKCASSATISPIVGISTEKRRSRQSSALRFNQPASISDMAIMCQFRMPPGPFSLTTCMGFNRELESRYARGRQSRRLHVVNWLRSPSAAKPLR
jgi:hypothetical protein